MTEIAVSESGTWRTVTASVTLPDDIDVTPERAEDYLARCARVVAARIRQTSKADADQLER